MFRKLPQDPTILISHTQATNSSVMSFPILTATPLSSSGGPKSKTWRPGGRSHQNSEQSRLCIVPAETDSIKENSSVSLGYMEREYAAIDAPVPAFESELVGITIAAPSRVAFPDGRRLVCGLKIAHDSPWQSLGVNRGVSY